MYGSFHADDDVAILKNVLTNSETETCSDRSNPQSFVYGGSSVVDLDMCLSDDAVCMKQLKK